MSSLAAALDIGGTKLAAGLVDAEGRVSGRREALTPATAGAEAVLAAATELLESVVGDRRVVALGVAAAGIVDPVEMRVVAATDTLAGWAGTDLRGAFADRWRVPIAALNDVQAHAVGEARHGSGAQVSSLLYVAVGTGVGAGITHRDLPLGLLAGAHAAAGHVGHISSPEAADLPCSCGRSGHLEAIAAGPALAREYRRTTGRSVSDLRAVAELARGGDEAAAAIIERGGRATGAALAGLINVLDPDLVVIGGGVSNLGQAWWQPLLDASVAERLPGLRETPVVASLLGADAALVGAAAVAREAR